MRPPQEINVLDGHGGFTAITGTMQYVKRLGPDGEFEGWDKRMVYDQTLWRPGSILANPLGKLDSFNEESFYQNNNDVTMAEYKVKGYRYRVACWFDNKTGERIA